MSSLDIVRRVALVTGITCLLGSLSIPSLADETKSGPMQKNESSKGTSDQPESKPADPSDSGAAPKAQEFSAKGTFTSICGLCHQDGGRKQGAGPKLMDNPKSDEELFNRIKFGKPGAMAAFGSTFNDDQIKQLVAYIRSLKPR